jgi:hypothetical protein
MDADMKAATVALTIAALLLLSVPADTTGSTDQESSCVQCHTNAQKIRSLYVPPKIDFKQDEGEG